MKKFPPTLKFWRAGILPIILLLIIVFFPSSKVDAQTSTDCTYENYYKESYKCFGVFDECQTACTETAKGSYLDEVSPADKYNACMKASDCHGKSQACRDQAWSDYQSCKNAGKSGQNSPKEAVKKDATPVPTEKGVQSDFSIIDSYVGLIWQQINRYLSLDKLEGILGETILHSVGKKSQWEKEAEFMSGESYKALQEAAAQRRLEKPEFFPVTGKEEFLSVSFLDKPAVIDQPIDVPGRNDIKVYPWGEGNGAAIQSNDWEKIKFREPVESKGVTSHVVELEGGQMEVKVRNSTPSENQFGVDAGWLGVTVRRTHFWVLKDTDKKLAAVVVYEGEVEIKTKDGKTTSLVPDGDKPGVMVITQKLSVTKLAVVGVILAAIIAGVVLVLRKRFSKGKKRK